MKKILLLPMLFASTCFSQTPGLNFNGSTDYVDMGSSFEGGRTIEFWFSPNTDINSSNPEFITLISRETDSQNQNEFNLSFQKSTLPNPGTIRFNYTDNVATVYSVYSNNSNWFQGRWYHVAAVIDPVDGMKLFIDGVEQIDNNPYNFAIPATSFSTHVGRWGNLTSRDFDGRMDDLHVASDALYSSNFTPPCPNRSLESSTLGLWNMNENVGTVITDASSNNNDGTIIGATWVSNMICDSTASIGQIEELIDFNVSPNPAADFIRVNWSGEQEIVALNIVNSAGQKVQQFTYPDNNIQIDMSSLSPGIYFVHIFNENNSVVRKVVKN